MLKPITLKPVTYLSLLLGVFFLITYLLIWHPGFFPAPISVRYKNDDPIFAKFKERVKYEDINDLLEDVEKHQNSREYQAVIDILRDTDLDHLVTAELDQSPPLFIVIAGEGLYAYGLEDKDHWGGKYKFVGFPGTSDTISSYEYYFWYPWAEKFTRRYNAKLESEVKKKGQ